MPKPKALILDMDGVLWRDQEWLTNPQDTFPRLRSAGLRFAFATNNATRTVPYYLKKFADAGVELEAEQIINSGIAAANYLVKRFPQRGGIFVVGEWGLEETLQARGFEIGSTHPLAVVCGMDRQLTYDKIKTAAMAVRAGAAFIGTNPDKSFPTPEGLAPGAGAVLAAIEAASDVSPLIIGKPEPAMYEQLLPYLGTTPAETLVIGDRLETDIAGAQRMGCQAAAVLTGVSTEDDIRAWRPTLDYIAKSLDHLVAELLA